MNLLDELSPENSPSLFLDVGADDPYCAADTVRFAEALLSKGFEPSLQVTSHPKDRVGCDLQKESDKDSLVPYKETMSGKKQYADQIMNEILPFARKFARCAKGEAAIAGISRGGFGAMSLALSNPK